MAQPTNRQCPLCEPSPTYEAICPFHAVPTVDIEIFDLPVGSVSAGAVVAGRYKVERALESGGMGTVLIAKQIGVNRTVALKVLRPDRAVDLPLLRRFYNEAHAISSLSHPNIVQVFDFGFDAELRVPYLAMEYIEGQTLDRMLDTGPLGEKRAARLLAQVARALVEAHAAGIVHRDLKPANVIVVRLRDGEEHVKVLDFGVAKIVRTERDGLTAPGMTLGSPHYMSPEQARAEAIDGRSDLYSLGCVLYELLTAKAPFDANATIEIMQKQVHAPRPSLPERLIADKRAASEPMRLLYDALLSKRREERPGSAATVARIFAAIAQGSPIDVQRVLEDERTERTLIAADAQEGSGDKTAATVPAFALTPARGPAVILSSGPGRGEADRLKILNAATAVPSPEMLAPLAVSTPRKPHSADEVSTDKSAPKFTDPTAPGVVDPSRALDADAFHPRMMADSVALDPTPLLPRLHAPASSASSAGGVAIESARWRGAAAVAGVFALLGASFAAYVWARGGPGAYNAPIAAHDGGVIAEAVPVKRVEASPVVVEPIAAPAIDAGVAPSVPAIKRKAKTAERVDRATLPAAGGREVRIITQPAGASILRGGSVVGTTPMNVRLANGESAQLIIKKQGYLDRTITVQEDSPATLRYDLVEVW